MTNINFLDLAFQNGQKKSGLNQSGHKFTDYFQLLNRLDININHCGKVEEGLLQKTGFNKTDKNRLAHYNLQSYELIFNKILELYDENIPLLNWGGDHSVGMSTALAFINKYPNGHVLWIDAHADINTPDSSLTGSLHGMPVSFALNINNMASKSFANIKRYLQPNQITYIGTRDLDLFESKLLKDLKINIYSCDDVKKYGMASVLKKILLTIKDSPLHISFDIDSMDPQLAPSTGVPVTNGLNISEVIYLFNNLNKRNIKSLDIVEINPQIGTPSEVDKTYLICVLILKNLFSNITTNTKWSFYDRANHAIEKFTTIQQP